MRVVCLCLLLLAMRPLTGLSQQANSAQQGGSAYDLWLVRSQTITADLIKDSTDLTASERAQLWARLAAKWWRDDPAKARLWVLKPIEIVETVPNKENPDERRRRLATVRLLLEIIAPLDQKLSARLVAILTQDAEQEANAERAANSEGLVEAAISLVEVDAKRAAELGALAVRIGAPPQITWLIAKLRVKDPGLATGLLLQTFAALRQSLDRELLNSLTQAMFPTVMQPGAPMAALPDNLRTELLKLDLVYLQANPINAENQNFICISVASFIAPVLTEFDRLLPQQASIVRQAVNQCQTSSPLAQQRMNDAVREEPLNTIDDLLKAGDDSQDMLVRTVYQYRAASMATQQNDFDRALKILDSMSTESREIMGGSWEAYRWSWAATAALQHLKSGDVYRMRFAINAVPRDLRPFAMIAFVDQMPTKRDKDTDPSLEFLSEARAGLRRLSESDTEKWGWYFGLLPLTVQYQPAEATAVLKEAVVALNSAAQVENKNTDNHEGRSLSETEFAKRLPASLLEMDEFAVKEAISSITSAYRRVQVRLELLSVCLERLRSANQATPNQGRSTFKKA